MADLGDTGARVLDMEREADPNGEWIPYCVRMKLDLAAVKISLEAWQALSARSRAELIDAPIRTDADMAQYADRVERLAADAGAACASLSEHALAAVAAWRDADDPPAAALGLLARAYEPTSSSQAVWSTLGVFGRFLVCSFARKQDADGLARALAELGVERP